MRFLIEADAAIGEGQQEYSPMTVPGNGYDTYGERRRAFTLGESVWCVWILAVSTSVPGSNNLRARFDGELGINFPLYLVISVNRIEVLFMSVFHESMISEAVSSLADLPSVFATGERRGYDFGAAHRVAYSGKQGAGIFEGLRILIINVIIILNSTPLYL